MVKIEDLVRWVEEGKGRRSIDIEIGKSYNPEHFRLWFYDYDLGTGQQVLSLDGFNIENINIKDVKEREELRRYEELKNKYEMEASKC